MSIRYKLLLLMAGLTTVTLGAFLILAVSLFKQDKIAYIFEESLTNARSLSSQVQSELKFHQSLIDLYLSATGNSVLQNGFANNPRAQEIFQKDESLQALYAYKVQNGAMTALPSMQKATLDPSDLKAIAPLLSSVITSAVVDGVSFRILNSDYSYLIYGQQVKYTTGTESLMIVSVTRGEGISQVLKRSPVFKNYVVRGDGQVIMQSAEGANAQTSLATWEIFKKMKEAHFPEGASQVHDDKNVPLLSAYSQVGLGNLIAFSTVEQSIALRAITILILKSGLFFLILLSASVLVSVIAAQQVTRRLRALNQATTRMAEGDFQVHLETVSKDEVGSLSTNFNKMASQVSHLMKENVDKARMEKELETAKIVQDTLFPPRQATLDKLDISGFYEPASECGGDWWYYYQNAKKVFVCVGDATGHGAPAALMTSAARAAMSLIEVSSLTSPAAIMKHLNRALYETSKGKIQMTFFIAGFDFENNILTYANASHEAPYLVHSPGGPIQKKDLIPLLLEEACPRLGESLASEFKETATELAPGDRIFFYTDGLVDVTTPEGKAWEERGLLKALTQNMGAVDANTIVSGLSEAMAQFRQGSELKDDVTFFVCNYTT